MHLQIVTLLPRGSALRTAQFGSTEFRFDKFTVRKSEVKSRFTAHRVSDLATSVLSCCPYTKLTQSLPNRTLGLIREIGLRSWRQERTDNLASYGAEGSIHSKAGTAKTIATVTCRAIFGPAET